MKAVFTACLALVTVCISLFFAADALYVGLFASPAELARYPWGTESGWSYLSRRHYMASGLGTALLVCLPLLLVLALQRMRWRWSRH
ncbi:hypothetical protein [Microbulbifer yueqingensis]|uniref:Uncharacterized protein n=1 Tax=Microbulbifer yueqingensis TaxID=658219 RepID=A0A1G8XDI7_9GAMM|nr:hypothetical protein [Microbulbifer yueqingensis]SDJ88531.1 hypothetical protein SAMN05216212_1054 [Microbulbifer yueqingensis]